MDLPLSPSIMRAFHFALQKNFEPFSREVGATWQVVCPWIEGFSTPTIQVFVKVYHAHIPSLHVKLRLNSPIATLGTEEGTIILSRIKKFATGIDEKLPTFPDGSWTPDSMAALIAFLADDFREFAMPLIKSPDTDWLAVRSTFQKV